MSYVSGSGDILDSTRHADAPLLDVTVPACPKVRMAR